jgi:multimeric flavodoxin WrbA
MKVLGISGSPRKEGTSGVYKLVKTVVENTGCEYEVVSLTDFKSGLTTLTISIFRGGHNL